MTERKHGRAHRSSLARFDKKYEKIGVRHGYLFLHPDQFDKLIGNLTTGTKIRFYTRQDVQSECDLIGKVEVTTRKIEPARITPMGS